VAAPAFAPHWRPSSGKTLGFAVTPNSPITSSNRHNDAHYCKRAFNWGEAMTMSIYVAATVLAGVLLWSALGLLMEEI
jgi:hypothetical protein